MNFVQEIRERRVPQITGGYVGVGWAVIQFLEFLEGRMTVSPHLVNLVALALLLLLPAVVTLAWVHGRPGRDTWGRTPKVVVPANVIAAILTIVFLFQGRELGAVTRTIEVEDENGAVSERVVPKSDFRQRVVIFYFDNGGAPDDDWVRDTTSLMIAMDVNQDVFVDCVIPLAMPGVLQDLGSDDGHGLTRPQQRKIAVDADIPHFLTGTVTRSGDRWTLTTELHESRSGKVAAERTFEADGIDELADAASRVLREDLGIPGAHIENSPDLPVAEILSSDIEAVKNHAAALSAVVHHNDWEGAVPLLEDAVSRDPGFASAQFLLFGVHQTLGNAEAASTAIAAAMENLYRLPERTGFMIKTQYYYNERQDADRAMAVLDMWTSLYPDDIDAHAQTALFRFIRQDVEGTIASYERILQIDPSRVQYLEEIADLQMQLGNHEEAERHLLRYVEIHPMRAEGHKDLADFYSSVGRLDDARRSLEQACLLDPEEQNLALRLIDLDAKSGQFADARERYLAELERAHTPRAVARIQTRLANLAGITGRGDDLVAAIDAYRAATAEFQSPLQADIVHSLMLPAVAEVGMPGLALEKLDALAAGIPAPYDGLAGVGRAWALCRLDRLAEAEAALDGATEVVDTFKFETFRPSLSAVRGMIAQAGGDLDGAVTHLRSAVEAAIQTDPLITVLLTECLVEKGDYDEALAVADDALMRQPAHPQLHLEAARAHHGLGNDEAARAALARALEGWVDADAGFPPLAVARDLDRVLAGGV